MSPKLKDFLLRWLKNILGLALAAEMVSGIHWYRLVDLLLAAFLLSALHVFVRPLLKAFFRVLTVFTLGFLSLVINGAMLFAVALVMAPYFSITSFWTAFWGAIIVMFVSGVIFVIEKIYSGVETIQTFRQPAPPPPPRAPAGPPPGTGPIIDI